MKMNQLFTLYSLLDTECRAIESLISKKELKRNPDLVKKVYRLKSSLFTLKCLYNPKKHSLQKN